MTAQSPRGGRRDFPATAFDGDSAWDTYMMRDALVNNLLHCADEAGAPCFANFIVPNASLIPGTPQQYLNSDLLSVGTSSDWYQIITLGPYDVPAFAGPTPYAIRVRLAVACDSGVADFAIAAGQLSNFGGAGYLGGGLEVHGIASATPVDVAVGTFVITSAETLASRTTMSTLDDAGGVAVGVDVSSFYVRVWGRAVGKGPQHALLYGVQLAAFVGSP